MGIEENKAVILEWVRHWNDNDHESLGRLYDDESFDWRISGLSPVSRKYTKAEVVALMGKTFRVPTKEKLHLRVKNLTAEDDRVSLEAEGSAVFADGTVFRNFYHILFTIRNGKVIRGRAYLDTWLASNSPLQKSIDQRKPGGSSVG